METTKYFLFILTFFLILSCDDFLNKYPHDKISSEIFWKNESDLEKGLSACYSVLHSEYFSAGRMDAGVRPYFDALTDNLFNDTYWAITAITTGSLNPTTGGLPGAYWGTCFKLISRVNIFLDKVDLSDVDESLKNTFRAEARFLRAFGYHELILNYGDVPLFDSGVTMDDLSKGRTSKDEIRNFIQNDLDFAINNLTEQNFHGHVVKNSARGLKARVCLYNNEWLDAAEYAQDVMLSGKASLYPDYQSLFWQKGQGSDNTEILFSVKYSEPNIWHNIDKKLGKDGHFSVLEDLVLDYLTISGLSIEEDPVYDPETPWKNRDPRLKASVFCEPGEPWAYKPVEGWVPYQEGGRTYYRGKKFVNPEIMAGYDTWSTQDIIHLRYADVLLMYAEAKNELGQFGESEWNQTIRPIRIRAGFTADTALNFPGGTKEELRKIIRHERRIELALEGLRYYDLLRWGTIKQELENIRGENPQKKVWDENKRYWPIPQTQIDYYSANGIPFAQNPGY